MAYLGKSIEREMYFDPAVQEHDDGRTGEPDRFGIKVIRFTNDQVLENHEFIVNKIKSIKRN